MSFGDTGIRWCDKTWNPVHGCSKTGSPGCANCYAEAVSHRFGHTEEPWLEVNAEANITVKPGLLDDRLTAPSWVFVNSMSDLLHAAVPAEFIADTFAAIRDMERSAFQVLTKHGPDDERPVPAPPPKNLMLGVSVGHPNWEYRLDWLREQPATTRFVSFEPLVACVPDPDLTDIDWAIIGGESGQRFRRMDPAWARNVVRACRRQDVAVFFKQHSGPRPERDVELDMQDGRGQRRIEEFPELPAGVVPAPREFLAGVIEA